eukprot:CAMPEP_0201902270 /NCGR_PEP_ID=MMETSP0902-20130614/54866_1 /ASSEMBLY_ACC=CAM_ASM_000551 /TAXON_ID=420261 /ORGANISM="Thalassiosira antarctica, Strain CCMP982" /LENGTH=293 /DNA_ID=CAMNT_0048436267 /DNA_START=535 /DNA_END=1414 /DNA_ORIENTATION=-
MPTETRIFALKSDGSVSNQGPSTIRSVPKCTTTAWDASINGDDSDEEIGDWIYRSSDTAKAVADAQKAADALTEKCEHSANQNQTSNSPRHSSILNGSGTISKGADLGQKDGARQKSAVPTKRTIPAEGGDDSTPPKGPVGHLVAKKDAPTKRRVEVYVVDMEACQLVAKKDAPTKRRVEVYVVDMEAGKRAATKGAPTMPEKEVSVGVMEQIALPKRAAMMDAPTILKKEVSVQGTMGKIALTKCAAMMDATPKPEKEGSVGVTGESRSIQKHEVMKDAPPSHQMRRVREKW